MITRLKNYLFTLEENKVISTNWQITYESQTIRFNATDNLFFCTDYLWLNLFNLFLTTTLR